LESDRYRNENGEEFEYNDVITKPNQKQIQGMDPQQQITCQNWKTKLEQSFAEIQGGVKAPITKV
jgi:hypothetical protein